MKQNYERILDCAQFGRMLISSGDLDPVYVAIYRAQLKPDVLAKLLVAYWCLYHLGAAARIAESKNFWATLEEAARNNNPKFRWPRGSERRHWRGDQAVQSFLDVKKQVSVHPERYIENICEETCAQVMSRVKQLRGFGPWIAFKVADMLERVWGAPVKFSIDDLDFYDEPRKGAHLYYTRNMMKEPYEGDAELATDQQLKAAVQSLQQKFKGLKAPPGRDRPIGIQEIETVLCKWKSHLNGHYPVGKDIVEVREGLAGWGELAEQLYYHAPGEFKGMQAEFHHA